MQESAGAFSPVNLCSLASDLAPQKALPDQRAVRTDAQEAALKRFSMPHGFQESERSSARNTTVKMHLQRHHP